MSNQYKLPLEWIDRIFKRLGEVYGSRFASKFMSPSYVDLEKTRWQSGLFGVTPEQIRHVLNLCKQGIIAEPPHVIEFYHYCKGIRKVAMQPKPQYTRTELQQQTGEKYLKLIMEKINGKIDSEGKAALSALDKQILSKHHDKKPHWQDD